MNTNLRVRFISASLIISTAACGCTDPMTGEPMTMIPVRPNGPGAEPPMEQNIVRVNKFFHAHPWLVFDNDGSNQIDGVRFSVYLEGPQRSQGVFGSGTMFITMYQLDADKTGREVPTKLQEWELTSEKAYPWRAKKQTLLGWGYGVRLHWDNKLKLEGKQIALVIKYVREDGQAISSSRQVLKVPVHSSATIAGR